METPNTDPAPWDDPDRAVQVEDDNPEALAGEPVEFDEAADDGTSDDGTSDDEGEA